VVGDLAVERAAVEQLIVGAAIDEPAAVEDDDLVGERDRREPVGDDERSPRLIAASVWASTDDVASSRIRIRGSASSARAIAIRCRCPPDSVRPRSPTIVS